MASPLYTSMAAVDADGQVDHEIGTETVGMDFFYLLDFRKIFQNQSDFLVQKMTRNRVHQVGRGLAQNADAGAQDQQGYQGAGQRIDPGIARRARKIPRLAAMAENTSLRWSKARARMARLPVFSPTARV